MPERHQQAVTTAAVNLSSIEFWSQPPLARDRAFRILRDTDPVSWQPEPETRLVPAVDRTGGYWALVRHDDIRIVSRDPQRFVSGHGTMLEDLPPGFMEAAQSFLVMDGERHAKLRGLVSAGFTPRQVRHLEGGIATDVDTILDDLEGYSEGDFVELVSKRLPLMTIMRMLGVSEDEREELVHQADAMVSWNDPVYLEGREPVALITEALQVLQEACLRLCRERRERPGSDLVSALVAVEVDGERLTDEDIASFFVLLTVAGNDTTRHTTSHAMLALCEHPEQRALLAADPAGRIESAVEEMIRWASPVMTFRRTAVEDTVIGEREIRAGQKVVMFYSSGNRDERVFVDAARFDVLRSPNRHPGFGGGGPHYCLGAALARLQLRVLFTGLLQRFPDLEVSQPAYLVGNFVNGIVGLPMRRGS